jgi:predicted enzyme related to lactoylglutathione lyase
MRFIMRWQQKRQKNNLYKRFDDFAPGFKPSPDGCSAALEVENFDAAVAHLKTRGVTFRIEPMATPVCRMALIFDPDGNSICIHKRNPGR